MNTNTNTGYKLFEMDKYGQLHALFINRAQVVPVGEWIAAEYHPTKGFAARGGWHIGADVPDAPWLKSSDGSYKSCWKTGRRVWCEIEYNANHDYNEEVKELPKKCFEDRVPEDGFYFFREVGKGTWVITSDIRVIRIIEEDERRRIMESSGYDEIEAFAPYKATFEKRAENRKRGKARKN